MDCIKFNEPPIDIDIVDIKKFSLDQFVIVDPIRPIAVIQHKIVEVPFDKFADASQSKKTKTNPF